MSNSVHRQWIKQACIVTEVRPIPGSSSSLRVLLSDKQLKMWGVLSSEAMATLTRSFPEFGGSFEQAALLTGGIILPLRYSLRLGASLREIIMIVEEFAYKGGAGNNEFAAPLFHMEDAEVAASVARARNMDMTPWMEKPGEGVEGGLAAASSSEAAADASSSSAAAASRLPFVASLRSSISSFLLDPRHHHLESSDYMSAEQQHALDAIEGFQRATLTSGFTQVEGTQMDEAGVQHTYDETDAQDAAAAASQRGGGGGGGGEPDDTAEPEDADETMGASAAGYREFTQAPETVEFSQFPSAQHQQVRAAIEQKKAQAMAAHPAAAAAASALPPPPPPPIAQFSATQLMIKGLMRAEAPPVKKVPLPAAPTIAAPAAPVLPAAAVSAAPSTSFVIQAPLSSSTTKPAADATAASVKAAAAKHRSPLKTVVEAPVQEEEKSQPAQSQLPHSPRGSQRSPARSSASQTRPSLRASLSPAPSSPARNSLSVPVSPARSTRSGGAGGSGRGAAVGGEDAAAPDSNAAAPDSMHNLLPNSLDPSVGRLLTPTPDEEQEPGAPAAAASAADDDELDEDEARQYEREESQFPFLTQAPHGSPTDEAEESEHDGEPEGEEGSRPPRHPAPMVPPNAKSRSSGSGGGSDGPVPMDLDSQPQQSPQPSHPASATPSRPLRPLVPASQTPSPSSLRIPPTPSPGSSAMSSAKTSPQPAAAASSAAASYSASSIAQRQQEREQRIQQQMEDAEKARLAEAQRVQRLKDEETTRLARLEEERQAKLAEEAAAEAARQAAEAEAEAERAQAASAAAAIAAAEDISEDEDAYEAAAMLGAPAAAAASSVSNKRGRAAASPSATAGTSALPPPAKKSRVPRGVGFGSATLPPTASGGILFVEDRVRAALEALEKHKGGGVAGASASHRATRMQPLKLISAPSSATPRVKAAAASSPAAAASPNRASAAAAAAAASSSHTTAAAAAAAASPSSNHAALPLFADRRPVGLAEVQCALRYFRSSKGKQSQLRALAAKTIQARPVSAEMDDEASSAPSTSQPQDPEYSQCF